MDMFMATERKGVWNIHGFGVKDEVILCESLFDALLLWCHGYRNVTCMFGEPKGHSFFMGSALHSENEIREKTLRIRRDQCKRLFSSMGTQHFRHFADVD